MGPREGLRGVLALGLWLLAGCGGAAPDSQAPSGGCRDDVECGDDQVCFRNGCGDPGKNLVVEVTPNPKEGLFAQDLAVAELRDQQTLELSGPSTLQGQILVKGDPTPQGYTSRVTLRVTGESLLLPNVPRVQGESTLSLGAGGTYSLAVGTGRYTVKLFPADTELPPLSDTRDVGPGSTARLDFLLPAPTDVVRLTSQVLGFDRLPLSRDKPLEVQVVNADLLPLSQRAAVNPETGAFSLSLLRSDLTTPGLSLLVISRSPLVPQVRFALDAELRTGPFVLADYGASVNLRGRVLDAQGQPVAGATVSLSGQVEGGGTYRSAQVQTHEDGRFELVTLPSAVTGSARELRLAIVPQAGTSAGSTEQGVMVPRVSSRDLGDVRCQPRRTVAGTVLGPRDELPVAGVQVEANLLQELKNVPRPAASRVVAPRLTDEQGHYSLALDPGIYRFEFSSVADLPRYSRIVTVYPGAAADPQDVSATLPKGRLITGYVRFTGEQSARTFVPNAGLRFFRPVNVDGQPSALLLGVTSTNAEGAFSATLPLP